MSVSAKQHTDSAQSLVSQSARPCSSLTPTRCRTKTSRSAQSPPYPYIRLDLKATSPTRIRPPPTRPTEPRNLSRPIAYKTGSLSSLLHAANWELTLDLHVQAEQDDGPEASRVALANAQSCPLPLPRLSALGAPQGASGGSTDLVPDPLHCVRAAQPIRRNQHFPDALRNRAEGSSDVVHFRVHTPSGFGSRHSVSTPSTLQSSNRVATSS